MSDERRYNDHEIRQIFDLVLRQEEAVAQPLPGADGLTLVELQDVGRQMGLSPARITQAVAIVQGRGEPVPRGTTLGFPTSVGRVVPLPRSPTDSEWELLITALRTTFGARGEGTSQGGLREWSDGTLQVFIEPTAAGHRLRMVDSSVAVVGIILGGIILAIASLAFVVLLGQDDSGFKLAVPAVLSLLGGGLVAGSAVSLPRWARQQERRMEHIGTHAVSLLALPRPDDA